MIARNTLVLLAAGACIASLLLWSGCASGPDFPPPLEVHQQHHETVLVYDTNGDGEPDYWQYQAPNGRKHALAYRAKGGSAPGPRIELDQLPAQHCPHFIIVLDGVPFDVVAQLYQAGHFRLFYPPARVVCCFPSMTDLALADLFEAGRCLAYQARHFDRVVNRLVDGNAIYLAGRNSPWLARMDYRCSLWWDVKVYLDPRSVFNHELAGIANTFRRIDRGEACAYSVGTAGLGTRGGRSAIEDYLRAVDRLCEKLVHERRGRVKITLTADHGHNLVECRRTKFDELLKAAGYRPTCTLAGPRDVVTISYGLVTYAELHTRDPAGVARCLAQHPDVEFACYRSDDQIVVVSRDGQARIHKGPGGFKYIPDRGDPLKLVPILERLQAEGKVSPDGQIDDAALFDATLDHYYPDPLRRIWRAFHDLVENPPDVIANLRDGACHGSGFFHAMIGKVSSTHGSLNRMNSTTFALTMLGELPAAMRSEELLPALAKLRAGSDLAGRQPAPR